MFAAFVGDFLSEPVFPRAAVLPCLAPCCVCCFPSGGAQQWLLSHTVATGASFGCRPGPQDATEQLRFTCSAHVHLLFQYVSAKCAEPVKRNMFRRARRMAHGARLRCNRSSARRRSQTEAGRTPRHPPAVTAVTAVTARQAADVPSCDDRQGPKMD